MNDFIKAINENPTFILIGWAFGAVGWIMGIMSAISSFIDKRNQKKIEVGYIAVLEQAQRDWKGKYTQEQIDELTMQFTNLQKQVQFNIPKEAKRVLLQNQLNDLNVNISDLFEQYNRKKEQILEIENSIILDDSIRKAIEDEILPNQVKQNNQQRKIYLILLAILFSTVLPISPLFILPWLFSMYLNVPETNMILYLLGAIIFIVLPTIVPLKFIRSLIIKTKIISVILGIFFLLLWFGIIALISLQIIKIHIAWEVIGCILSYIPLSMSIAIFYNLRKNKKNK